MLKKHKSHGYIVANASVQFTLYAVVRDWATMGAEDDSQKDSEPDDGFSIVFTDRKLRVYRFVSSAMLLGVELPKKASYLATPHMVFTDN